MHRARHVYCALSNVLIGVTCGYWHKTTCVSRACFWFLREHLVPLGKYRRRHRGGVVIVCVVLCCFSAKVVFGPGGMGFTLMKDAVSRALVTRLAPGGTAFRLGVRTGASWSPLPLLSLSLAFYDDV